MPRPRILTSYNYKSRDVDESGEKDVGTPRKVCTAKAKSVEPDCEIIKIDDGEGGIVEKKQLRATTMASVTKQVRPDRTDDLEESDKLTSRMPPETKEAVTAVRQNSSLSLRLVAKASQSVARSGPPTTVATPPAQDYQSKPAPPARVARLTSAMPAKMHKPVPDSSWRLASSTKPSTGARQLVSKASVAAKQPEPQNSSLRSIRPTPNAASGASQVAVTLSGAMTQRLPKPGATMARSVNNAGAASLHQEESRPVSVAQLVAASSTDVLRLVPSSSPHVMHLLADRTLEIGRVLQRSTKRIPQLVKIEPTRPARSTRESIQSTRAKTSARGRILSNSTIQLPARMMTGLDNPKIVMVLPGPGKDTKIFQNPTVCTLQKIENSRELARIQQVVGVQRQRGAPPNNSSQNGKRTNETKGSSEPREKVPRPKPAAGNNADQNPRRMTVIRRVASPEEKSQEVKFLGETQKTPILVSREPTRDSSGIATRSLSAAKSAAIEASEVRANPVETKKTPSGRESSRGSGNHDSPSGKRLGNVSSGDAASSVNVARTNNPAVPPGGRRNVRLAPKANPKTPKLSNLAKNHARLTKILANQPIHTPRNTWRARCIVCKERFTDKYEFHRHATLSHPGIRIVFCELCSASFRFDDELRRHRVSYHKVIVPKDAECTFPKIERSRTTIATTTRTRTENRPGRPRSRITDERRPMNRKRLTIETSGNATAALGTSHSSDNSRARSARKKVTVSCVRTRNWRKLSQSTSGLVGPRRRQTQTTNKTQESSCDNVVATKNKIKSAEIKKLVVPITRLEGVALEKYMCKLAKNPVVDFTSTLSKNDASSNDAKPAGSSNTTETSPCSGTSGANEKLAKLPTVSEPGKMRKTRGSRTRAREVRNLTITRETKKLEVPAAPRRSMRRREAKKSSFSAADEGSNVAVAGSLNHAEASTAKGRSGTVEDTTVDSAFSSCENMTPIGESPQVADIAKEQQIIRKLVSRSSVSSCATLDSNRPKEDTNSERLILDVPDSDSSYSTVRRPAVYTSSDERPSSAPIDVKKFLSSTSKHSSSSDDVRSRKFIERVKSQNLSLGLSSSSGERFLRADSSTSLNSDESLFAHRLRSESARCSLKSNTFDNDPSKRNEDVKKRVGEPNEKSKGNYGNAREDEDKNRGESRNVREADQPDEERAEEKNTGSDEQSKDNVGGGDDRQDETDGDGKQTEEKSNGAEKQSGDKSNRGDEIDDGNEKSKNVGDKGRDERTDDDGEPREKTSHVDDEAKSTEEDDQSTGRSEKQPGEEAISVRKQSKGKSCETNSKRSKDSNNADDTSFNDDPNVEANNRETEGYPEKASTSSAESNSRKTYSCRKKLSKKAKEQHELAEDQTEAPHDLCSVCKQFFILMKKISRQVGERKTESPIKCPLCQRYFISMFHLKLHVATNHLQCPNAITCGKAKLSSVEETSRLIELDCQTVLDTVAIECPRCATTFDMERDLNDHLIAQHEAILPKDTASNEVPEYLRDLRIGCFETIIRESLDPNSSQTERESSTLDCSRCDGKFSKTAEYVRHLREAHRTTESALYSERRKNTQKSSNETDPRFSLYGSQPEVSSGRDDGDAGEIEESLQHDSNAQMTADREYVLRQLLSEDSSGDEEDRTSLRHAGETAKRKLPALRRDAIVEKSDDKTIVGYISRFHTCNVCKKKFRRAHDLLIHSFYHANNDTSKTAGDNVEDPGETSQNPQESCADALSKEKGNGEEPEKVNRRENSDNVTVVYGANGASKTFMLGSKRRATSLLNASSSKSCKKVTASKKRKVSSNSEGPRDSGCPTSRGQSRDTDKEEFLEPAVDLTAETDGKLPIACGKCNRHFANRSLLNEHLFFLHDDSLKDTVLEDVLASRTSSSLRGSRVDGKSEKSPECWRCDACVQNFKLLQGYSRHRYFVHGDDSMVHVCENCSKVLTSVTTVNVHICTDVASYNCRTCNETFSTGMSLRLHNTEKHTETRGPHVCLQCNKNFLTNAMLECHLKCNHRFVRPYRARRSSPARMAKPETTNDEEKVASSELDEAGNDEARDRDNCEGHDKDVNSKASNEPVESRRGRWRACRGKKITDQSPLAPKRAPAYRTPGKRKRGRPRKYPRSDDEESPYRDSQDEDEDDEAIELIASRQSTLYVDVTEIHQCSLCQLYCVSKSTLRNHMTRIHSANDEVCQLCQKAYTHGKLMRHVIDNHVTSEDGSVPELEQPWSIGTNSNETDTEILVKMLGIDRLVSLCEYRRYAEKINLDAYPCLSCKATFRSHELYRYHFLLQHDSICALCNIEFKTGHDAARHKNDVHGSVGRYIWFADRTVLAMTSTKNFADLTDRIFMDRLTRGETLPEHDTNEKVDDEDDDAENLDYTEILVYDKPDDANIANEAFTMHDDHGINLTEEIVETQKIADDGERIVETSNSEEQALDHTVPLGEVVRRTSVRRVGTNASNVADTPMITMNKQRQADESNDATRIMSVEEPPGENVSVASYDFSEPDDVKLIIVVTDEDLERFNIVTRHPNIWGLAAEISSTYEDITPNEVKRMLECHFERQEDFDA